MVSLNALIDFCDQRTRTHEVADFPGSENGLQIENNGNVTKIGAAVDAGFIPFQTAAGKGIDFLIVHHGAFWSPLRRLTGQTYAKFKFALDHNLALYSCHLPLDAHPEIGNNRLLADAIGLEPVDWFLEHEGTPVALLAKAPKSRETLKSKLEAEFPGGVSAMEFGSEKPEKIAILTGSGKSALSNLKAAGTDTLITGELRQEHFNHAQEAGLNLYCCGHYATEVYGVKALASEAARKFGLEWEFIPTGCPL